MMKKQTKFCTNCIHHAIEYGQDRCVRPQFTTTTVDIVNGDVETTRSSRVCRRERTHNWFAAVIEKQCGESGRFFVIKQHLKEGHTFFN